MSRSCTSAATKDKYDCTHFRVGKGFLFIYIFIFFHGREYLRLRRGCWFQCFRWRIASGPWLGKELPVSLPAAPLALSPCASSVLTVITPFPSRRGSSGLVLGCCAPSEAVLGNLGAI